MEWLTGILGAIKSFVAWFFLSPSEKIARNVQVGRLVNEVWDLLGGQSDTTYISRFARDPRMLEKARRKIVEAKILNPQSDRVHGMLGYYYEATGRTTKAIASFRKAVRKNKKYVGAWHSLGSALYEDGEKKKGEAAIRRALDIDPDFAPAWNNLGKILLKRGEDVEAEKCFQMAKEKDPESRAGVIGLGNVFAYRGDYPGAKRIYETFISDNAESDVAWNNLGLACLAEKNYPEALDAFQKAIDADNRDGVRWHNLGIVLNRLERFDEATAAMERATDLGCGREQEPNESVDDGTWILWLGSGSLKRKLSASLKRRGVKIWGQGGKRR